VPRPHPDKLEFSSDYWRSRSEARRLAELIGTILDIALQYEELVEHADRLGRQK
jgi:hypothetical protein